MPIRIDEAQFDEKGRLAGIAVAAYTLRAMEKWRARLTDYDCVMIMIAVIAITAGRLLRTDVAPEYRRLDQPMERPMLARCNISSIAHATGLNRETTRRKVNDLIEQELLTRDADGSVRFRTGLVQEDRIRDQLRGQLGEIAALANQLIRLGVLVEE